MSDLLMHVGEQFYPWPQDFGEEAMRLGISKRVPRSAIPHIEPGRTRLAVIHPKAGVHVNAEGMTLLDLAQELFMEFAEGEGYEEEEDAREAAAELLGENGESTNRLVDLLRRSGDDLERLEEKYELEWLPGVFGYGYLTGVQYVCEDEEDELPDDLRGVEGIEPVRMEYG